MSDREIKKGLKELRSKLNADNDSEEVFKEKVIKYMNEGNKELYSEIIEEANETVESVNECLDFYPIYIEHLSRTETNTGVYFLFNKINGLISINSSDNLKYEIKGIKAATMEFGLEDQFEVIREIHIHDLLRQKLEKYIKWMFKESNKEGDIYTISTEDVLNIDEFKLNEYLVKDNEEMLKELFIKENHPYSGLKASLYGETDYLEIQRRTKEAKRNIRLIKFHKAQRERASNALERFKASRGIK